MRFERIVSKDKKSQSWLSANLKSDFLHHDCSTVEVGEKNAGIFVLGEAQRSDAPEAHSCALRTRRESATKHSAKRPSFVKRRDFFARQGTAKRRPADVLVYVEDTQRSRDAV